MRTQLTRATLSFAAALALLVQVAAFGDAQAARPHGPAGAGVYGRVVALYQAHAKTVVKFDLLQLPGRSLLTFRVTPSTSFIARSAQASVAGFSSGDFAIVSSQGSGKRPIATTVKFDTRAFRVYPSKTVTGVVAAMGPGLQVGTCQSGSTKCWVVLKLPDGTKFKAFISSDTIYSINGVPQEHPFNLGLRTKVLLTAEYRGAKWFATLLDERT